jgi:hypothetical protein
VVYALQFPHRKFFMDLLLLPFAINSLGRSFIILFITLKYFTKSINYKTFHHAVLFLLLYETQLV